MSKFKSALLGLLLVVWLAPAPAYEDTHPVTGRKYAGVMSADGAGWLVRPEREAEENPDGALDAIGLKPGMNVGDVGAGVGYMSLRMARRITPGKVWANDIQPRMLELLRTNA